MSADTIYQQLRGHLAYLKLAAVADALAPALEAAERELRQLRDYADTTRRRLRGRSW